MSERILLTGGLGQLGSELAVELCRHYGESAVTITDVREPSTQTPARFYRLDARDASALANVVKNERITRIYHLAALLSATAENRPHEAWEINMGGLVNVLEVAREVGASVFTPSSIGAFGPQTPKDFTPQDTIQRPTSMYGVTKVAGELLCDYYYFKFGVDTRGVRFPGIISNVTPPGGGTTDYAVDIYYAAVRDERYTCFLQGDTYLDMIYMPDAIKAAIDVMEADPARLRHRNAFNVTAMSFSPEDQAAYIRRYIPEFEIVYDVDPVRQAIANSWPNSLEDYAARVEWDWEPEYDLDRMTADMLRTLSGRRGTLPSPSRTAK
ncbi:MAG: NAD-dependent epimerase/dehydratase family protein [Spirochaetota bacterium]